MKFTTAGNYPSNALSVNAEICRCGKIKDGVAFTFGEIGGWILAFKDLEAIYHAAQMRRVEG